MIDNPKIFIYYVVGAVLILALVVAIVSNGKGSAQPSQPSVQVGTSTPASNSSSSSSSGKTVVPAAYDALVTYYDSGFSPSTITVGKGQTVRFLNRSNTTMRVSSVQDGNSQKGISEPSSVGYGGTFDYNFVTSGTYLYQNLNDKNKTGIVQVQ